MSTVTGPAGESGDQVDTATAGAVDVEIVAPPPDDAVRSAADVVRLVVSVATIVAAALLGFIAGDGVRTAQAGLTDLVDLLPNSVREAMAGSAQVIVLAVPIAALVALLVARRMPVIGRALLAVAVTTPLCMLLTALASGATPESADVGSSATSWIRDSGFPGTGYLGSVAALATVMAPWVDRRWRRAAWCVVGVASVLRVLGQASTVFELVAAMAIGVGIGSIVLLVFGAPDRAPGPSALADSLADSGLALRRLTFRRKDHDGERTYEAETTAGERRTVLLQSDDDRRRDLLFRVYRFLRVKSPADEEVLRSTRSLVEHHAFLSLWAHDVGVHSPRPVAVVPVGTRAFALVEELVEGTPLVDLDADDVDDALLGSLFAQGAALADARIAHRDLRGANILVSTDPSDSGTDASVPSVAFVGWSSAVLSPEPALVDIDIAELLCVAALTAGVDRTVAAAVPQLGSERLAAALPYLQPAALTDDTRRRARHQKSLVDDLRTAVAAAAGTDEVPLEKLQRVTLRQILMVGFIGFAIYLLLPMFASLPEVWQALQDASWGWILATLPLVGLMYVGSTLNFLGAVPQRLPFGLTYQVQLASAFLNRVTPKNVGGMALRLRFLTLRGVDPATAGGSVGLTSLAGTVSTTVLMVVFFLWAGRSDQLSFNLPSLSTVLVVIIVIGCALGLFLLTPIGRRLVLDKALGFIKTALENLGPLLRDPTKMTMLLGGNALNTLFTILALSWTLRAFGTPLPFAQVGVVFLGANLVSNAAPTPGGVGVVEASLIFLLQGFGVPDAAATSAVLVFRLTTYWLVTLPGWLVLHHLRHEELV